MKTQATLLFALLLAPAIAAAVPANHYVCGGDLVSVTYDTSSFVGVPLIQIQLGRSVYSARGDEIRTQPTVLGSLVTITRRELPDNYTDTLTLVTPDVSLTPAVSGVSFTTYLFSTRTQTNVIEFGPAEGAIQTSTAQRLQCKASAVEY